MQAVLDALDTQLSPRLGGGSVILALSGGLDSLLLLHALAPWCQQQGHPLKAVHVHHGLSANADAWVAHCQAACDHLQVPLAVHRLNLQKGPRQSLEALARDGRYQALAAAMAPGDCLVTGHHQDDQAETFLLAARRGSGLEGLAAMPVARAFGPGLLVRPLLGLSRQQLEHEAQGLHWVEDESNQDTAFDRNFLRQRLLPQANQRLGGFSQGLARSAGLLQQELPARDWLLAQELRRRCLADGSLDLAEVPSEAAALLLRAWTAELGLSLSHNSLAQMLSQQQAREDASVRVGPFGRFQGRWYLIPQALGEVELHWQSGLGLASIQGLALTQGLPGSTSFHPHDRDKGRTLKKLWQEWGIPPWLRAHWPLLVDKNGVLVAVPGLAVSQPLAVTDGQFPTLAAPSALMAFQRLP